MTLSPSTSLNNNLSWKEQMVREHRVSRTTNMSWIQVTFYGLFCSVFQVYERRICWWLILLHPPEINYLSKLSTAAGFQPRVVHSHSIFVPKKNKTKTLAKKHGNGPGAKKGAKCLDFWVFCWQGSHWPKGSPWNPSLRITPHHSSHPQTRLEKLKITCFT